MDQNSKIDQTDLTFFTNEEGHSLLSRFKSTLEDTELFDVLVGYFRASGFIAPSGKTIPDKNIPNRVLFRKIIEKCTRKGTVIGFSTIFTPNRV